MIIHTKTADHDINKFIITFNPSIPLISSKSGEQLKNIMGFNKWCITNQQQIAKVTVVHMRCCPIIIHVFNQVFDVGISVSSDIRMVDGDNSDIKAVVLSSPEGKIIQAVVLRVILKGISCRIIELISGDNQVIRSVIRISKNVRVDVPIDEPISVGSVCMT